MARTPRKRKQAPSSNQSSHSGANPRKRTRKNRSPSRKNKTAPESLLRGLKTRSTNKRRTRYNLRNTNSVIFISETPCCISKMERDKYDSLGLNSAMFLSSSVPARRRQSHISVITISSSDDDIAMDRTAEWVAKMDVVDVPNQSCREEAFVGDVEPLTSENLLQQVTEAENIREQMSLQQILPRNSVSMIEPSSLSLPATSQSSKSTLQSDGNTSTSRSKNIPSASHKSFLTNPPVGQICNATSTSKCDKSPQTIISVDSSRKNDTIRSPPRFYFGPQQSSREIWNFHQTSSENSFPQLENVKLPGNNQNQSGFSTSSEELKNQRNESGNTPLIQVLNISVYEHSSDGSQDGSRDFKHT